MPNDAGTPGTNKHRATERTIHRCEIFRFLTISALLRNSEEELKEAEGPDTK
jgi:hypothetical protein